MAKLFSGNNNIDPSKTNIPTEEQNQAQFLSMQKRSQEMIDFQTNEYLDKKKSEQYADLDSAFNTTPGATAFNEQFAGMANPDQNQDMSQEPVAEDLDDIHRSWASQFQESFLKGVGETVIGSTGDVINMIMAPLPGFTIAEGNQLGRMLREYGDEMGNEHTTYLRKKLEGKELAWGDLVNPDFWSTNVAEMIPMALEFMVTGMGAGSAAKKGMGIFTKAMTTEARLARATLAVTDTAEALATGSKVAKDVLGTGKGLAKYLTRNVDGVLEMSKFSNEFVNAAGAGLANNLLTGATNAMDYHRRMQAQNEEDIANGKEPRYTEEEMASTASWSMAQNLLYAPIDMLSWGISYAKAGEKIGAGLSKKIGLKASEQVAKEAAQAFTKTTFPIMKGLLKSAGHAVVEGAEETFQETYEEWVSMKAKERVTGEVAPDYWDFYFSKENKNTKVASFAMGALMGGAMNLKFNESAKKGIDYMDRMETLKASIDTSDKGGQTAKTWHIRNTMVDLLHADKTEAFDGFMSDLVARGSITPEEVQEYEEEFKSVKQDYEAAASLNVAGKIALAENTIKAKSLERFIENENAAYEEKVRIVKQEFGENDESLLNEAETQQLEVLRKQVKSNPDSQPFLDALEKKIKDRSTSAVQKKYAKLKADHEQQIEMLSLNLALAQENRLNLISGKKAKPLNIKFWTNQNGNEIAYIVDENGQKSAVTDNTQRELVLDPATMTEGQMGMAQEQGGIISGLSDAQYDRFVKMTDDEIYESAKVNHEKMLATLGKEGKKLYNKMLDKGKDLAGKVKAKINPDGTVAVDENNQPIMEPDDSAIEQKVDENLKQVPTSKTDDGNEDLNAFEKDYQEAGLETVAEAEARKTEEAEAEFRKQNPDAENKNSKEQVINGKYAPFHNEESGKWEVVNSEKDNYSIKDFDTEQEAIDYANQVNQEEPTYQPVKDKVTGKYFLVDTKTGEAHPNGKPYSTAISAKKDLGNASIVGGAWSLAKGTVRLGVKGIKGGVKLGRMATASGRNLMKKGGEVVDEASEAYMEKMNAIKQNGVIERNIAQDQMRREIIEQAYFSAPARNNANNPDNPVTKQQLDAYLDTKIAAFKWGPRAIDEQRTVNRMLKAKGIDVNVVLAQNLFSLVGIPAVGYCLASTIYIDENVWDQPEVFMHEMAHINYRLTQDKPETKAIVSLAREDQKLVDKVERLYADKIVYKNEKGIVTVSKFLNYMLEVADGETEEERQQSFDEDIKEAGSLEQYLADLGVVKAPDSEQHVINEELFTHYLQGPLAKNFNQALEPIKERRRQVVSKNWWKVMKGDMVTLKPFALDVVQKLNNGKQVPESELMEHIFQNFAESSKRVNKKAFNAGGFASLVDTQYNASGENHDRITQAKIEQRQSYDAVAAKAANRMSTFERLAKKIREEVNLKMKDFSEIEISNQIDYQLSELENAMLEEGAFDDYESAKSITFRGATRILNSFTRSLNYVKRKRFMEREGLASDFDENTLIDRDVLIAEFYNLAFETKGNTNAFIAAIENSRIEEVWQFNQYMEKMHPGEKMMYLSSMAHVMGNQQTISAIKSVVTADGKWETHNALSETEKNKVDRHMEFLSEAEKANYKKQFNDFPAQNYQYFLDAYNNIKAGNQTNEDYLAILRFLAPKGLKFSALVNNQTINMRGHNVNVKTLVDKLVKSKVMDNPKKPGSLYVYNARPFVEALVDSNRKYTSYSVIQNAEGNMEPSKITNNHLLSELNDMNDFLVRDRKGKFPTFKSFKERYAHLSDAANRTHENPVLRSIYDNAKNGVLRPSVSQYVGLTHLQRGANSLYKNSTDFAQTIEDFMMFANVPNANNYVQTLSAFADSPRKFLMSVNRIKFEDVFQERKTKKDNADLKLRGQRLIEASWRIYDKSNENLSEKDKAKTIRSQEEYVAKFKASVNDEIQRWNRNAKDLIANGTINPSYFEDGKLSLKGQNKIAEFVFNQSVNGMALAEIFNPGIPFNDIVKRNKGNSSPVLTFGNKNLKMEAIPIDDSKVKRATDSGMYMTKAMAQKIVDAGLGVFDLNNGLKLLNYHVERDNPNFQGKSAYFKGYTTIISEETLVTEPGLRGIYNLLNEREKAYNAWHVNKFGKEPSLDLTNGENNYINYAVPFSAIKSDFFSAEQKQALSGITYEALEAGIDEHLENQGNARFESKIDEMHNALDAIYYGENGFMGLSTNNFGPQQIMDKVTTEATTPVQFMSSVIVNGMVGNNLKMGEQIQSLIRKDMTANLDEIISELGNMEPNKYKTFILKNLDLENMDQGQRLMIEESLTNLNHPAIADFITNTLANRLKQAGNKLKTAGSVAQQKPSAHYRYRNGITIDGRKGLAGHADRYNKDGSVGSQIMEIVLPNHMKDKVKFRQYLDENDPQAIRIIKANADLMGKYSKALTENNAVAKSAVMKEVALMIARQRHGKAKAEGSYGFEVNDYVGEYYKDGVSAGWFVRGESVMATRIPSHGPASTGVFEAVDYLEGEGNQVIVHEDFSETAGSDYDGDSLFIQRKDKSTPNFNEALEKTVDLWTSPGMRLQTRAKIEFENEVKKIIGTNTNEKVMPMSPAYHREAYNNTMISKRNIGIIFNTHRIANYLAAYNVKLNTPINIDGTRVDAFSDKEVGQESRNNKSAMLANIILDNAKWGFADALGLNDQTINQYSLLTNLGFSLKQLNDIMNSKAVKVWNKHQSNNDNPFAVKMKNADVKKAILHELGIDDKKVNSIAINTDPMMINTKDQMKQIVQLMELLETVNADILHVSKIMAGHKGIENNPFILEQQLKDFNSVINSDKKNALLTFPEAFKNNPDIKAYHDNAEKILGIMKKANNIYSLSTSKLVESLNEKIGYDDTMDKKQMERVSDLIKRFHTSRILGLNNISSTQKNVMKQKVFKDVKNYIEKLQGEMLPGNRKATALDKSVLFNRALNIDIKHAPGQKTVAMGARKFDDKSYVSANPRFFNESLTEEDRNAVQEEWKALPEEIKDGLIMLDLMKNGLTGKLSLSIVFDQQTNHDISTYAAHEAKTKNEPIDESIMLKLENLVISNEFNENKSLLNATNAENKYKAGDSLLSYIAQNNPSLEKALRIGGGMIFKVDGKPYIYEGFTDAEKSRVRSENRDFTEQANAMGKLITGRIRPFKKFENDVNLEVISLAGETGRPVYKSRRSETSKANSFMEKATIDFQNSSKKKVKSDLGNASRIDYHNYNDVAPLNQREFNGVMEYDNTISDEQKESVYKKYLQEKKDANDLTSRFNQTTFSQMSDDELKKAYSTFAQKDIYAYSIITTPLVIELANRMGVEQSAITGAIETGKDISLMDSWFNNNNISSNHPVTQNLVRKLNEEYKKFVLQRGKYIKVINNVTDALYQEKFGLSKNKIINTIQRIGQSLFRNRSDVYKQLYGNLLSEETYTDKDGVVKKTLKFKDENEIQKMYNAKQLSKAEYDFYTTFRKITGHLKNFDGNDKVQKGYIPHTAMDNFEMFANRGLLGLMVNSKGIDSIIEDVKLYTDINGKRELMTFRDIQSQYNALALSKKQTPKDLLTFNKLRRTATKLQKTGKNEDGSRIIYSNMQNETLLGMSPLSRFESSRSATAELMPSMDLNKALVEYVHASIFTNGDEEFQGFKAMMPMIDGVMAYNDKNGYKNAYSYVKEVIKEGFIMKKDQITFGKNTDAVINGLVKGNTFYALGYKGLLIGKGLYAIGNLAVGKYMNLKREGGKSWLVGEARYWGIDKGISVDALDRRRRAKNILSNLGYMEADFYDDVNIESKTGLDDIFTKLALSPMAVTENWIQRAHMLGMLTQEEFDKFDENGNYKTGETQITPERFHALEERVKNAHGKGFSPTDQSRIHRYALGKMFMQFSRHLPTQIRERFAKEDIDMNGQKYIGSLRQVGRSASDFFHNGMSPAKAKEYYASLEPHQKEAFLSGLRGMALMTMLGFIAGRSNEESQMLGAKTDAASISSGVMSDANIHFDMDRLGLKTIPPSIRSAMSVLKMISHGGQGEAEK